MYGSTSTVKAGGRKIFYQVARHLFQWQGPTRRTYEVLQPPDFVTVYIGEKKKRIKDKKNLRY